MFPNFLLLKKEAIRTKDPMFSFLILGKDSIKGKNNSKAWARLNTKMMVIEYSYKSF